MGHASPQAASAVIHPTAHVDDSATLGEGVVIGPFCYIGPNCHVGAETVLHNTVTLVCNTRLGEKNILHAGAVLGGDPQDLKYKNEDTWLEVGDANIIREVVTMHRATGAGHVTTVGSQNMFMAGSHVGHNSVVGNYNTLANAAQVAGHVQIGNYCVIGGLTAIHQGVRVGDYVMAGGCTGIRQDVPHYTKVSAKLNASLYGLNSIGLRRAGLSADVRQALKQLYRVLFNETYPLNERVANAKAHPQAHYPEVQNLIQFVENVSARGLTLSSTLKNSNHREEE
jgi:UDP-N-acetylglucosamine acyltransferase